MLNHIRTVLLNMNSERAASVVAWRVDPSFLPVDPGPVESRCLSDLFGNAPSDRERADIVEMCMPFLLAPEFAAFRDSFDTRSTVVRRVGPVGVSEFQESATDSTLAGAMSDMTSDTSTAALFGHVGSATVDAALDGLNSLYHDGAGTWKAFAAAVYALVFRLDFKRTAVRS